MKKFLSIILSLMLIFGTICAVPTFSASAAGVTAASFTDGVTWTMSDGPALTAGTSWYTVVGANGSVTINQPNFPYRSAYAKITGFTAGETYVLSFTIPSGIEAVRVALDESKAQFSNQALVPKSGYEDSVVYGSISGTTATVTFTAANDYIYLTAKNTSLTVATFNNFSVRTLTEADLAGNAIADGTWKATNGTVTNNTKAHTVTATGLSYHSIYTTVSNLTPNTIYELTFDMSANTGFKQLWLVSGTETIAFSNSLSGYPENNVGSATVTTSGTRFVAQFTASETSYHLVFRDYDATVTDITLSNFVLTAVRTLTEADLAGNAIADGTWKVTAGSVTNNTTAHKVSLNGIGYQAAYTTVSNLASNTIYEISFDMSVAGGFKQLWLVSGTETIAFSNSLSGYPENNVGSATVTTSGTRFVAQFTANETSYHLVFRNYENIVTDVTFSNFSFKAVKTFTEAELAGKEVANGEWAVTQGAGGKVTKANNTVTITGAQYQQISVPLTNLKANTTYTLKFNHTAGDQWQFANPAYVIPGETAWSSGLNSKAGTVTFGDGSCNTADITTIRFTTNDTDTNYLVAFNCAAPYYNGVLGTVVLSNFTLEAETAYEAVGTAIRAASEETTQAMRFKSSVSKDILTNGYNGKEVVEYGTLAVFEDKLTTDFTYENVDGKSIKKGVAYSEADGINVVFAEDDNTVTYTAALTNISTDNYARNCVVRSYIKLSDDSVIYGETQTYSVYSMFKAILSGDSDADKAVVENILNNDEAVNAGYSAWITENN